MKFKIAVFFLMFFLVSPLTGLAEESARSPALGLAPSGVYADLLFGESKEGFFNISRTDKETVYKFEVTTDDEEIVDLHGVDELVIPAGQESVKFDFTVKSASEAGERETLVYFTQTEPSSEVDGSKVQLAIAGKVKVTTSKFIDPASVIIDASSDTEADYHIIVEDLRFHVVESADGNILKLEWNLTNIGENKIQNALYSVEILRNGLRFNSTAARETKIIEPDGSLPETYEIEIPASPSVDNYRIEVTNSRSLLKDTMLVYPTKQAKLMAWLPKGVFVFVSLLITLLLGFYLGKTRKKTKTRNGTAVNNKKLTRRKTAHQS